MANISMTLYDGDLEITYDCSGAIKCKYALWEVMPIDDDEHCVHRYCGSCRSISAQIATVENAKRRLSQYGKKLKAMEYEEA